MVGQNANILFDVELVESKLKQGVQITKAEKDTLLDYYELLQEEAHAALKKAERAHDALCDTLHRIRKIPTKTD